MDEKEAAALVEAVISDDLMEQTADYLGRDRFFEGLSDEQLLQKWETSLRTWVKGGYGPDQEHCDVGAELRLRNIEEPWDRIPDVRNEMFQAVQRIGPNNPGARAKIEEFLESLDKEPKN